MEDMDINQAVEVPDTPDRLASRRTFGRESVDKVCNSPLACNLSNPDAVDEKYVNGPRVRGRLVSENGHIKRLVMRPPRNLNNLDIMSFGNSNVDNSSASNNAHIFRRAAVEKGSSHEAKRSNGAENMDKGKAKSIKISSKPSSGHENTKFFDLTKHNGHSQSPKKGFRRGLDIVAEDKRKGQVVSVGSSSVDCIPIDLENSRTALKGKEKIDDSTCNGLGLAVALGKGVNLSTEDQHKMGQQKSMPLHSATMPRVSGQKRLVRNGCISPLNIATRAKQLAEQNNNSPRDIELSHAGNVDSGCSPSIADYVTEDNNTEKVKGKGKGVVIHSSTAKDNNAGILRASGSSFVKENKEGSDISSLGNGGWRTLRNRSSQIDVFPNSTEHLPTRTNRVGNFVNQHQNRLEGRDTKSQGNQRTEDDFAGDLNATQTALGLASESSQAAKTVSKRQKKGGLSSGNHVECSTSVSDDSDIIFLGSPEASEFSKSSRIQRPQFHGVSSRVIGVDESLHAAGDTVPEGIDSMNDDSDARARQLEADEILARELQEQLYHEVPITGSAEEIDEHLAWALQQEENTLNTSSRGSRSLSQQRGSTILHSNRQPRPESSQNNSNRRITLAQAPSSSRIAQLRTRYRNQSSGTSTRGTSSRGRNRLFPFDMDLDMRMDILEAFEEAYEDLSDVGVENLMLQVQRDFNDNDYEMLLALDDNNHQHAGATVHQINNLPQSTVQSDASSEACAICLETPTLGETVRHLPCLHRFHKDCIDPWLGRRTSCPVCKCSIT